MISPVNDSGVLFCCWAALVAKAINDAETRTKATVGRIFSRFIYSPQPDTAIQRPINLIFATLTAALHEIRKRPKLSLESKKGLRSAIASTAAIIEFGLDFDRNPLAPTACASRTISAE